MTQRRRVTATQWVTADGAPAAADPDGQDVVATASLSYPVGVDLGVVEAALVEACTDALSRMHRGEAGHDEGVPGARG